MGQAQTGLGMDSSMLPVNPSQPWPGEEGLVSAGWTQPLACWAPGYVASTFSTRILATLEWCVGDFALILVTLLSTKVLGNTSICSNQYLLQLQRMGLGNCRLMNGSKAAGEQSPTTTLASPTSVSALPLQRDDLPQVQTQDLGCLPHISHPTCPVTWGLLACFGEHPSNQGNPRFIFPSRNPSIPESTFGESPSGVGRQCGWGRQAPCSIRRCQCKEHLPVCTENLHRHLSQLWASSWHIWQVSGASTSQSP